jgi:hypothetical protein
VALYSAGFQTVAAAAGAAYCEFRGVAGTPFKVRELSVGATAATVCPVGIVRALAQSVTPSGTFLGQAMGLGAPPAATMIPTTIFGTAPTITANTYLEQYIVAATIGSGFMAFWSERDPLEIAKGGSLLLWNYSATLAGILTVKIKWEE